MVRELTCFVAPDDMTHHIDLLPNESSYLLLSIPSTESITFYQGNVDMAYLRSRMKTIAQLNPWIAGRLVKSSTGLQIVYTNENEPMIVEAVDHNICESMPYHQLTDCLSKYSLPIGQDCLEKSLPVFRLTVITISSDAFAILCSMCHNMGDGHTFHKLYGMLSEDREPEVMDPIRIDITPKIAPMVRGCDWVSWYLSGATFAKILTTILFRPYPETRAHIVSEDWLRQEKNAYHAYYVQNESPSLPSFVSSFDILASKLFQLVSCDIGSIACNMRNRMPDNSLGSNHAGNYLHVFGYLKEDFEHPHLIRQSLGKTVDESGIPIYCQQVTKELPNWWTSLTGRLASITSWVSFYVDVKLPGATSTRYYPIKNNKNVVTDDFFVIFKLNPKETGILSFTRNNESMNWNNPHALFGKQL